MVHVALPKLAINQLKPVQQRRQQEQRAYCPDKYTVVQRNLRSIGAQMDFLQIFVIVTILQTLPTMW